MKRWTLAALAAASLLSATAIANTQLSQGAQVETRSSTAHVNATHWRTAEVSPREKVREYVPSVNYVEGQTVGASVIPSF